MTPLTQTAVLTLLCWLPLAVDCQPGSGFSMKPNLYFGLKTRSATPTSTGFMWFKDIMLNDIRFQADEADKLTDWGWKIHDGTTFGEQFLGDAEMDLISRFYQPQGNRSDSGLFMQLEARNREQAPGSQKRYTTDPYNPGVTQTPDLSSAVSVIYFVSVENPQSSLHLDGDHVDGSRHGLRDDIYVTVRDADFGDFTVYLPNDGNDSSQEDDSWNQFPKRSRTQHFRRRNRHASVTSPELDGVHFQGFRVQDPKDTWQVKQLVKNSLLQAAKQIRNSLAEENEEVDDDDDYDEEEDDTPLHLVPLLNNAVEQGSNVLVFQKVFHPPFRFSVSVIPESTVPSNAGEDSSDVSDGKDTPAAKTYTRLFGHIHKGGLQEQRVFQTDKFERAFGLAGKGYNASMVAFAQAALANCLGSHGYFHGSSIVSPGEGTTQQTGDEKLYASGAGPLFTGVPSRSFFPRGFLWDEGFHQLLVSHWDPAISRDVLLHWLGKMDNNGWIAREQILGDEALSRVPEQFRVQYTEYANPPALLLAMQGFLDRLDELPFAESRECSVHEDECVDESAASKDRWLSFVRQVYPLFKRQYEWTKRTQSASVFPGALRWRGRSQDGAHTLTSGIDDYPRGRFHYAQVEAHVDLASWVAWSGRVLARMATVLGKPQDAKALVDEAAGYVDMIDTNHWDPALGFYADVGVIDDTYPHPVPQSNNKQERPKMYGGLVQHVGYVGLMPFLLQLVPPDSERLAVLLDKIADPRELWSEFGLRSLSKADPLYGQGEDYWRGKVWVNLNYLALQSLKYYSVHDQVPAETRARCTDLAGRLKGNIVSNIYRQYMQDGFLFENYNGNTGKGTGTRPFTGWSALVVLVMGDL